MSALDRLKQIQAEFKKNWRGINPECTGRPGTSTLLNKKRTFAIPHQSRDEDERQALLLKIFDKLTEIEDEKPPMNSSSYPRGGQSNFFAGSAQKTQTGKNFNDYLCFKPISDS